MRPGLYGKLPAKRDFIAVQAPREFLSVWEGWLQGGLSASRQALGPTWQEHYLRAPIWRFWLGQEIAGGGAVLGALMPSVDGVGRYFPLCVFVRADPGEFIAPPELDNQEAWLAPAEDLLLAALSEDGGLDALTERLAGLPAPASGPPATPGTAPLATTGGSLLATVGEGGLTATLASLRHHDHARAYGAESYWWTVGGEGFAPQALAARRLPDPYVFAGMLTGRFGETGT